MSDISLSERLSVSEQLYDLGENLHAERSLWKDDQIRASLSLAGLQVETAARLAIHHSPAYGEAILEAGAWLLRMHVVRRRRLEQLASCSGNRTLDCRDGRHLACETCDCHCHEEHS